MRESNDIDGILDDIRSDLCSMDKHLLVDFIIDTFYMTMDNDDLLIDYIEFYSGVIYD